MSQSDPIVDQCFMPLATGLYGSPQARAALLAALMAAQASAQALPRSAANDAGIPSDLRPLATSHGLSLVQVPNGQALVTILGHVEGATLVAMAPAAGLLLPRGIEASAVATAALTATTTSTQPAASLQAAATLIEDASSPTLAESLARVKTMMPKALEAAENFAPSKYGGEALAALQKAFAERRKALSPA